MIYTVRYYNENKKCLDPQCGEFLAETPEDAVAQAWGIVQGFDCLEFPNFSDWRFERRGKGCTGNPVEETGEDFHYEFIEAREIVEDLKEACGNERNDDFYEIIGDILKDFGMTLGEYE